MSVRTFVALDLDDAARGRLAAATAELGQCESKIRWTDEVNLHVTMKFLGDVADGDVAGVCQALADAAGGAEPFEFAVGGLRCVGGGAKVRMVWANVHEPAGRMAGLYEHVESALEPLGFPRERRGFSAHVTVGRVRATRNADALRAAVARYAEADFGTQRADHVVVYASRLTPAGPVYTPRARLVIGGT
jgi:2'-5' RNA ligase